MRTTMIVGLVPLWSGCLFGGTSFSGEIGGDSPKINNAFFVQEDDVYDGGDSNITIVVTDVPDPCVAFEALNDAADSANDAGDLEEAWEDNVPADFWQFDLVVRVGDASDDLSDAVLEGVAWDEGLAKDDEMYGVITHYTDHLDEEYWLGDGYVDDVDDYGEFWYSDGGDLEISKHKPDELIKGSFISEAADPRDGDNDGDFELSFSAERCKPMERYYY